MRIAICGSDTESVILRAEKFFGTQAKTVWDESADVIDYAAETYKYYNESNVIFVGSAFDFLANEKLEGYDEVYEQIALNSLENLDYIVVITLGMDRKNQKMYEEYAKLLPEKFYIYPSSADFEIVMK